MRNIELKTDIKKEVSQFFTLLSPNDNPLATIKNIETTAIQNDKMNPIIVNHQGSLILFLFFFL